MYSINKATKQIYNYDVLLEINRKLSRIETNKLENLFLNKRQRKPKGQSRMDNAETVATLRRQYT